MWKRFDNYMQNWYESMPYPKRHVVMSLIGYGIAIIIVSIIFMIQ